MALPTNHPTKISKHQKAFWLGLGLGVFVFVGFLLSQSVFAQTGGGLGLNEFAGTTNLGTQVGLISLVARIINIALGFLGVVAIGLIIYAGWMWMTSKGDAEKIAKAKKIMAGAVIGLAIVLSAFAIARFVINAIQTSTGGGSGNNSCPGGGPPPCIGYPGEWLVVRSKYPTKQNVKLCESVQAGFSDIVYGTSVNQGSFKIEDVTIPSSPVPFTAGVYDCGGDCSASNSSNITFNHYSGVGGDFEPSTPYRVTLQAGSGGLLGADNKRLKNNYVWNFETGTQGDNTPPEVTDTIPVAGATNICRNTPIQIEFSEPMLASSFTGNVELRDLTAGGTAVALSEPRFGDNYTIATYRIQAQLESNHQYQITVKGGPTGVKDTCGIPMAADEVWTFTTSEVVDCSPKIFSALPDRSDYDQTIELKGANFFMDGEVFINNFPADGNSFDGNTNIICWGGGDCGTPGEDTIRVKTPVGASTRAAYWQDGYDAEIGEIHINVADTNSNEMPFTVTSPNISDLSAYSGGIGQPVTISGWNFGSGPNNGDSGRVLIKAMDTNTIVQAVTNDVDCGGNWWGETEIVFSIPPGLTANTWYRIQVETRIGGSNGPPAKLSNLIPFYINTAPPGPKICTIVPADPVAINTLPTQVSVTGKRFGEPQETRLMTFKQYDLLLNASSYDHWFNEDVAAMSPASGTTNLLGTGDWRVQIKVPPEVYSNWRTLKVSADPNIYPQVVDYAGCAGKMQSPTPYQMPPGTVEACRNGAIGARFNVTMDPNSFIKDPNPNPTILVENCGADPGTNCSAINISSFDDITPYTLNGSVVGFYFYPPVANLAANNWYRVTILGNGRDAGVKSAAGNYMKQNFVWKFKTGAEVCLMDRIDMNPPAHTFYGLNKNWDFYADPVNTATCNNLNPASYSWTWSHTTSHISLVPGSPPAVNKRNVISISATDPGSPAVVSALASGLTGTSNVTVVDTNIYPEVVESPTCSNSTQSPSPHPSKPACTNAAVSARFNIPMVSADLEKIDSSAKIKVILCATPTCGMGMNVAFNNPTTFIYNRNNKVIGFIGWPTTNFTAGQRYKVTIVGGPSGVKSLGTNLPMQDPEYSWIFTVASGTCDIANVVLSPDQAIIRSITAPNNKQNFLASAVATNCNILNVNNWDWTAKNNDGDPAPIRIVLADPLNKTKNSLVLAQNFTPKNPTPLPAEVIADTEGMRDMSPVTVSADYCTEDSDCPCGTGGQNSQCINKVCQPRILNFSPNNGALGTWVTLKGCYFGNTKGEIRYNPGNVLGLWPDSAICGNTWTNTQVISEVPSGNFNRPITLKKAVALGGQTTDTPGNFITSTALYPGLCKVTPSVHYFNSLPKKITVVGHDFGSSRNVLGDNVNYYTYKSDGTRSLKGRAIDYPLWTNEKIEANTPRQVALIDTNNITVNKLGSESNPIEYSVFPGSGTGGPGDPCDSDTSTPTCDYDDGICNPNLYCSTDDGCTCQPRPKCDSDPHTLSCDALNTMCPANFACRSDCLCYRVPPTPPVIQSVFPDKNQTDICRNTLITITFDKDVNNGTISSSEFRLFHPGACASTMVPGGFKGWIGKLKQLIWPADAAPPECVVSGTLRASGKVITFTPSKELEKNTPYTISISASTKFNCNGFCNWSFTTGNDICAINSVKLDPSSYIFTKDGVPQPFTAQALSKKNEPLMATYDWQPFAPTDVVEYEGMTADYHDPIAQVKAKKQNGEAQLKVTASYPTSPPYVSSATGTATLTVFLCEEPWTYDIDEFDTRLMYCKGNTGDPNNLPELLTSSTAGSGDLLQQYFFKNPNAADVVGLRIYSNFNRLSPRQWYQSRTDIMKGNPSAVQVDGYDALRDAQTIYVGAVARANSIFSPPQLYNNIYVLSFNQGATAETVGIFNQIAKNWMFNSRLPALATDDQVKIRNDLKRLQDFEVFKSKLASYASTHNNKYPTLRAGTFMQYRTTSVWPSWQAELGNVLGAALPIDPINDAKCDSYPDYDQITCWNPSAPKGPPDERFKCEDGSHIYQYRIGSGATNYALRTNMEYKPVVWKGNPDIIDSDINVNNNVNDDACESFKYNEGTFIQMEDDVVHDMPVGGWPPFEEPALNIFGSPTSNSVSMVWSSGLPDGSGESFHYELYQAPDIPGSSPGAWSAVSGAGFLAEQYIDPFIPPNGDGAWWYKIKIVSDGDIKSPPKESQPVMMIRDSQKPGLPSCSPDAGTYTAPQNVSCKASDQVNNNFRTDVNVHFTIGSDLPTCNSPVFANPTNINSTKTLHLIACDVAGNMSDEVIFDYIINAVDVTATLNIDARNGLSGPSLSPGVNVKLDGTLLSVPTPTSQNVALGPHDIEFINTSSCYTLEDIVPTPLVVTGADTVVGVFSPSAPGQVGSPTPGNKATKVEVSASLGWSSDPCADHYNVYLGKKNETLMKIGETESLSFDPHLPPNPPNFDYNQEYNWRVDSVSSAGDVTQGVPWSFTTRTPPKGTVTFESVPQAGDVIIIDGDTFYPRFTNYKVDLDYGPHQVFYSNFIACYDLVPPQTKSFTVDSPTKLVTGSYNLLPPKKPTIDSPVNGATGVSVPNADLKWIAGDCTTTYKLYFRSEDEPSFRFISDITPPASLYPITGLVNEKEYFWRVDAINSAGTITGDIWSFTTLSAPIDITLQSKDNKGALIAGASVTIDNPPSIGKTTNVLPYLKATVAKGSHNVIFADDVNCHTYNAIEAPYTTQPRDYQVNTTVVGLYNAKPAPVITPTSPGDNLTGVSITPTFTWPSDPCADKYYIYYGTSANPSLPGTEVTSPYPLPTALQFSTKYFWRINTSYKGGTQTTGTEFSFTTAAAPVSNVTFKSTQNGTPAGEFPAAPFTINTTPPQSGNTQVTLTIPQGSYNVTFNDSPTLCFSPTPTNPLVKIVNINTTPFTVTGTYTPKTPGNISDPSPNNTSGVSVNPTLTWTGDPCADKYYVYFGTTNPPSGPPAKTINAGQPLNYSPISSLLNGTTYYWRVVTENKGVQNTTSQVYSFETLRVYQVNLKSKYDDYFANWYFNGAPISINTTPVISGNTEMTTALGAVPAGSYTVTYQDYGSCADVSTPTVPLTINASSPSGTIFNVEGHYNLSPLANTTYTYPSLGQTNLPLNLTGFYALKWNATSCALGYRVYMGTTSTNLTLVDPSNTTFIGNCSSLSNNYCTVTVPNYNTTYYWKVVSYSYGTIENTSNPVWNFTTTSPPLVTVTALSQLHSGTSYTDFPAQAYFDVTTPMGMTPASKSFTSGPPPHAISFNRVPPDDGCYVIESISPVQPMIYNAPPSSYTVQATWKEVAVPPKATLSGPGNNSTLLRTTTFTFLYWNQIICASGYILYYGRDDEGPTGGLNGVTNATYGSGSPYYRGYYMPNTYTQATYGSLQPGHTYYWRVDSFKGAFTNSHKGDVWSFSVAP